MIDLAVIEGHEIVYMYTTRTSDGALLRKLVWQEGGQTHRAAFADGPARSMGLDIQPNTILCQTWAMVYAVVEIALFESMGL